MIKRLTPLQVSKDLKTSKKGDKHFFYHKISISSSFCSDLNLLATISKPDLIVCLKEIFDKRPPSMRLIEALFRRFRPLKVGPNGEGIMSHDEMDIVDLLLSLNLLSRVTKDRKIKRK